MLNVTDHNMMFLSAKKLVGGAGTIYNIAYTDGSYAHVDGEDGNPGYFTKKQIKFI